MIFEQLHFLRGNIMSIVKTTLILSLCLVVVGICSCAPTIVGKDAGVYSNGTLYAIASSDLTTVYKASVAAVEQLELEVIVSDKDVFSGRIVAKGADGKKVYITMKPEGEDTHLEIKVGSMPVAGDQYRSRVIYDKITQGL
jgi:hypothetical protein